MKYTDLVLPLAAKKQTKAIRRRDQAAGDHLRGPEVRSFRLSKPTNAAPRSPRSHFLAARYRPYRSRLETNRSRRNPQTVSALGPPQRT